MQAQSPDGIASLRSAWSSERVREALALLVPLVGDRCALDRFDGDGGRAFVAGIAIDRAQEEALADLASRPAPASRVAVVAFEHTVGEVVVWASATPSAVEEALICVTAQRLGEILEAARLREALASRAAISPDQHEPPPHPNLDVLGHELRGPLQVLTMGLDTLRTRVEDAADEVPRQWLLDRFDTFGRAVRRIRDIADFVVASNEPRPEAARERIDLHEVVQRTLARTHEELDWSACRVTVHTEAGADYVGRWDPAQLETIVGNLVSNAMKYGAGRSIDVSLAAMPDAVTLAVRDHGSGIDPSDREKIFRRFYRGRSVGRVSGLGLGLAVVRDIVRAHQGTITVESRPDEGATFRVLLPRAITESAVRAPLRSPCGAPSR